MKGPALLLRRGAIDGLTDVSTIHEWEEGQSSLVLDEVEHKGTRGAIMVYTNPPVHQIGNPALDAMIAALTALEQHHGGMKFLLLTWPCDPVHAGGDLKESLGKLEATTARRAELEAAGAPGSEIEALYAWADGRLDKGRTLYRLVRRLAKVLRTVGVCGGGVRFGGSAEVNLMADVLVGDSRSGMCFSESMIGLIPGWAGVGRTVTKAGVLNARWMAQAATQVMAADLRRIGIYDRVLDVTEPLPAMKRTDDPAGDKARYAQALEANDAALWPRLTLSAIELATCAASERPGRGRVELATAETIEAEVARRANPETYRALWGKPLAEAKAELAPLGRPLAPQSVAELETLLSGIPADGFFNREEEDAFVDREKKADARLYRDERLAAGIKATLEQKVANFSR
jgi:enoyl-CoA hydratase/carnithine racemase